MGYSLRDVREPLVASSFDTTHSRALTSLTRNRQGCFIGCPECDHMSGRRQTDLCGLGVKATVNDPLQRSLNRAAVAGSPEDIYRHNPWRRPGSAPVAGACGLAGGTPWGADAPEAGDYENTTYAHHGMNGTDLKPMPTGTVWKLGSQVQVNCAWSRFGICPSSCCTHITGVIHNEIC